MKGPTAFPRAIFEKNSKTAVRTLFLFFCLTLFARPLPGPYLYYQTPISLRLARAPRNDRFQSVLPRYFDLHTEFRYLRLDSCFHPG